MSTTDADKEETESKPEKKDEITGDSYVWDAKQQKYVQKSLSPELYRQEKAAQRRQATMAGLTGLGAEAVQFGIGATIFSDPAIEAQGRRKAAIAAELRRDADLLSEAEKSARREASIAPMERKAEERRRRAEAIMASSGNVSVDSIISAGDVGAEQIRQQALEIDAQLAKEDVDRISAKEARDEKLRKESESIDAMMLELRNKYIREPLHKFIGDAGKLAGTLMAHAPARTIDAQVADLKDAGASNKVISDFIRYARWRGPKRTDAEFNRILGTLPRPVEGDTDLNMANRPEGETEGETEGKTEGKTGGEPKPTRSKTSSYYTEVKDAKSDLYDKLYVKGNYAYGYKDGVWTVYNKEGTKQFTKGGKAVRFTLDEAKNHKTSREVRELYDLAVDEGLVK